MAACQRSTLTITVVLKLVSTCVKQPPTGIDDSAHLVSEEVHYLSVSAKYVSLVCPSTEAETSPTEAFYKIDRLIFVCRRIDTH